MSPMLERVVALQRVGVLAGIPGRTLAAVARRAAEIDVPSDTLIIEEGALEEHMFVVVHGRLRVHRGAETIAEVGPGQTIGELAALVPKPRAASVTTAEPTRLLRIDKPVLDELLADHPQLARSVIASLVTLLRAQAPDVDRAPQ